MRLRLSGLLVLWSSGSKTGMPRARKWSERSPIVPGLSQTDNTLKRQRVKLMKRYLRSNTRMKDERNGKGAGGWIYAILPLIRPPPRYLFSSSGSLAMLAAPRRASSCVGSFAAESADCIAPFFFRAPDKPFLDL